MHSLSGGCKDTPAGSLCKQVEAVHLSFVILVRVYGAG